MSDTIIQIASGIVGILVGGVILLIVLNWYYKDEGP